MSIVAVDHERRRSTVDRTASGWHDSSELGLVTALGRGSSLRRNGEYEGETGVLTTCEVG
jgi:hypothetical protein